MSSYIDILKLIIKCKYKNKAIIVNKRNKKNHI